MDVLLPAPVEAPCNHAYAPDVLAAQSFGGSDRIHALPRGHLAPELDPHGVPRRKTGSDFIEPGLGGRNNRVALLMEERWEKQKLRLLELEAALAFADA